jgi:hypothetical protein
MHDLRVLCKDLSLEHLSISFPTSDEMDMDTDIPVDPWIVDPIFAVHTLKDLALVGLPDLWASRSLAIFCSPQSPFQLDQLRGLRLSFAQTVYYSSPNEHAAALLQNVHPTLENLELDGK